ncbi:MAG: hypothetical protein O210_OD1C00001G0343 [Parcubacteria bacterium RAAC4_OD1_1]|nr:MAG: hypothetical protein O210_OD1C00001G0343 [Parcubacteria bacterium RAAC4_OD1_1]
MEKFSFNKKINKPDAEQLEIKFDNQIDDKKEEPLEAPKENGHLLTEYDFEVIKELEQNGDIEEVKKDNNEDESYVSLKELKLDDNILFEKEDQGWELFGRFNEAKRQNIENKKNKLSNIKKSNIGKDPNEGKIRKAFNKDNIK